MTETTQPDPQVEPTDLGSQVRGRLGQGVGAIFIRTRHREEPWLSLRTGRRGRWDELNDVKTLEPGEGIDSVFLESEVRDQITPLTVADIPAGQGPASLFLAPFVGNLRAVYFKAEDGRVARVTEENRMRHEMRVLWDHLAATLPHVTTEEGGVTALPADTRPGLNADHLTFLAHLIATARQAGVTVVYCCLNVDWSVMTSPELDDEAGAAFLAALGVGEVGEPEQKTSRTIRAGRPFTGDGVCLYVRPTPTEDATEDAP